MQPEKTGKTNPPSGIVLFAKRSGLTSFSALFTIKHALKTGRVGHTGTLDSFASGLLVVCSGTMTRMVSRITELSKEYEAVLKFGVQTDTLDYTGSVVRKTALPRREVLTAVLSEFTGSLQQVPPEFSALHVNGHRASDLARQGKKVELPPRKIFIYKNELLEIKESSCGVEYARILFTVSRGTYIRSLARDIAAACGSSAHLAGLRRTRVGSFRLEDAAGSDLLGPFTIDTAAAAVAAYGQTAEPAPRDPAVEAALQQAVCGKLRPMTPALAAECDLIPVTLRTAYGSDFFNGRQLDRTMFTDFPVPVPETSAAVFSETDGRFLGVIKAGPRFTYDFVIH